MDHQFQLELRRLRKKFPKLLLQVNVAYKIHLNHTCVLLSHNKTNVKDEIVHRVRGEFRVLEFTFAGSEHLFKLSFGTSQSIDHSNDDSFLSRDYAAIPPTSS